MAKKHIGQHSIKHGIEWTGGGGGEGVPFHSIPFQVLNYANLVCLFCKCFSVIVSVSVITINCQF